VRLPALGDSLDAGPRQPISRADRARATEIANACVERLNQDPNNVPARENLGRLFAESLDKSELGIEQLLLDLPDVLDLRRAEWLGLMAAWQLKLLRGPDAARTVLERLVRDFPRTPQALSARHRLHLMDARANNT